jgi:hypothetical protein
VVAIFLITAWVVYRSVFHLYLSPDSANYLSAAENLVANGRLVLSSNYTSHAMSPSLDPYTEWPPGFPIYLAAFVILGRDPFISAVVAQAFAIVLYNAAIYSLARKLQFHPILIITIIAVLDMFEPFAIILNTLSTETLFIALTFLAAAGLIALETPPLDKATLAATLLALFLATCLRFAGVANVCWAAATALTHSRGRPVSPPPQKHPARDFGAWGVPAAIAASIAPLLLWLIRNRVLYGASTFSFHPFAQFHPDRLIIPFQYASTLASSWGSSIAPIMAIATSALIVYSLARASLPQRRAQTLLVLAMASHFLVVWLSSLVASVGPLTARLMAPTLAIGTFAVIHGMHCLARQIRSKPLTYAFMLLPLVLLAADKGVQTRVIQPIVLRVQYPPERALWQEIHTIPQFQESSHFYSDADYVHEVFSNIPQRLVWDYRVWQDPYLLVSLTREGIDPFFVVRADGDEQANLESFAQLGFPLRRMDIESDGFAVYYVPDPP